MDHPEREAAERHPEAQHVRHQIRLEELRRLDDETDDRHDRTGGAGQQQRALMAGQLGNRDVGGLRERYYGSLLRSPAGTSASVACSLNWSARTYAAIAQRSSGSICAASSGIAA